MKTPVYTVIYLLLASAVAYIAVVYLGMAGMGKAIFLIAIGFTLVGASAFTSAYSKRWGEKGGQRATIVLRNLIGIPLWFVGFVLAWLEPSSFLFNPNRTLKLIGLFLIISGSIPFILGHIELGWRTHMPSVKDTLVRHGLYAYERHPIYAGGFAIFAGLALIGTSFATTFWYWLVLREEVGRLSMFFFLVPAFGLGIATLAFGEKVSLMEGIGAILTIVGVSATAWKSERDSTQPRASQFDSYTRP